MLGGILEYENLHAGLVQGFAAHEPSLGVVLRVYDAGFRTEVEEPKVFDFTEKRRRDE